MSVTEFTILGEARCGAVVAALVYRSQWFQVEPLPDDEFRITLKRENAALAERLRDGVIALYGNG